MTKRNVPPCWIRSRICVGTRGWVDVMASIAKVGRGSRENSQIRLKTTLIQFPGIITRDGAPPRKNPKSAVCSPSSPSFRRRRVRRSPSENLLRKIRVRTSGVAQGGGEGGSGAAPLDVATAITRTDGAQDIDRRRPDGKIAPTAPARWGHVPVEPPDDPSAGRTYSVCPRSVVGRRLSGRTRANVNFSK